MTPLLKVAIEAHGGLERWRRVHGIDCKLTIGGGWWQLKGLPQGLIDVALHVEPADRLVGSSGYRTHDPKYPNPSEEIENMKFGASTEDRDKGTAICLSVPPRSHDSSHKRGEP